MRRPLAIALLLAVVASCAGDDAADRTDTTNGAAAITSPVTTSPVTTSPAPTTTVTVPAATTVPEPTALDTTTAPSTTVASTSTTVAPTTVPSAAADVLPPGDGEEIVLGASVQGRPISVIRRGEPSDTDVLVVGVIHGDEDAGAAIVDLLRVLDVPDGVELWLVPTANPDGQAAQIRHNVNGVDLNRNFPHNWGPIAEPGNWQYAGSGPASEPETQAMVAIADLVRPDLTLWYHQDLFRISPSSGREGEVRARYAELTGLPLVEVTGGTYTGTASTWSRTIADDGGVGFTVELGPTLSPEDARRHADAVLDVAQAL